MIEIYRSAFRYYWSVLPMMLGFAALTEGLLWLLAPSNPIAVTSIAYLAIIYQFHRHYLFGESALYWAKPKAGAPPQKLGWFLLISLALTFSAVAISVALAISIAPQDWERSKLVELTVLIFIPIYLIALSVFGTALPASVARPGNFKMSSGIKATFGTMWRLILGPGLAQILVLGLIFGLHYLLQDIPAYQSPIGQLGAAVISTTAGFLPSLLGVAVFCHMYKKIAANELRHQMKAANHS